MKARTSTESIAPLTSECEAVSTIVTTASPAPSSTSEAECYFTATAVPIRASVVSSAGLRVSTYSSSPLTSVSPHHSTLITLSEFPPPPGHSHPSYVYRKPLTPLASVRDSTASSTYGLTPPVEGRASVLSATPSLFPLPPSANGRDAHIKPLFSRRSTLSSAMGTKSTPGPTPPAKDYRPTFTPTTNDYFSPSAPTVTAVQEPRPTAGIIRMATPLPPDPGGSSRLLPPSQSPISQHSPVTNPNLSPLTLQTLSHLQTTALRSPSLTFVESVYSPGLSPLPSNTESSCPLTSAQKDRLWEKKRAYDDRRNRYEGGDEKRWLSTRGKGRTNGRNTRRYLWAVAVLSLIAFAGIVGLIVGVTLAMKGAK